MFFISISFFCFGGAVFIANAPGLEEIRLKMPGMDMFLGKQVLPDDKTSGILEVENSISLYLVTLGEEDGLRTGDMLNVYTAGGDNMGKVRITNLYDIGADVTPVPGTKKLPNGSYKVIWEEKQR